MTVEPPEEIPVDKAARCRAGPLKVNSSGGRASREIPSAGRKPLRLQSVPEELTIDMAGPGAHKVPITNTACTLTFRCYWDYRWRRTDGHGASTHMDPAVQYLLARDETPVKIEVDAPAASRRCGHLAQDRLAPRHVGCQIVLEGEG